MAVSTFYVSFVRRASLHSAGIDSEEKVVNVVSHGPLSGSTLAISIKFP